jgi:glycosyltransferase involved in cell wall biosynthesis
MNNCFYHLESLFFENIIVLSESLRRELGIAGEKCRLVPIGAEPQCFDDKSFDSMRLLYVGTFFGRRMEDTVEGFGRFYRELKDRIRMSYDIVGYGSREDVQTIMDAIERCKCKDVVKLHGRIPYKHLGSFLEKNNIGVAYIPLQDHYQCQPSTKIFEYHLAGMPVIATETNENARVINEENGILIRDDCEAFFEGLKIMYQNLRKYNSSRIRDLSVEYTWEWIINKNLAPYLAALIRVYCRPKEEYRRSFESAGSGGILP